MKKITLISLLLAVAFTFFEAQSAYAMTFVTPSGAVVNEFGQLISGPSTLPTMIPNVSVKHSTYETKVFKKPVYITFSSLYNYF